MTSHRDRATPGYRMFSPLGLQKTFIINMLGDVVHSWDLPYEPAISVESGA